MSNENNKNPNINKFFNKLYRSFPNILNINKSEEFGNVKYIYKTNDSSKWFVKIENNDFETFLFGKIKENIPQPPLLKLNFDKINSYSKNCYGIINAKYIYINVEYFIKNYPGFKTTLNETIIDIFIKGQANSVNVINLGNYPENIEKVINNINILLNELEEFKPDTSENESLKENKCEICGKKLKKEKQKLCKKCSKKQHAASILIELLNHVKPEIPFRKNDLNTIYNNDMKVNDCIWSLEEFNLIKYDKNEYYLENQTTLTKFIEKYNSSKDKVIKSEDKKEEPKKLNKKCSICNKTLPISKFYKSKKTNDGLEDYCKNCKRYVNTANYLKDLLNQINPGEEFKVTDLTNNFKNPMEFIGRLWELQDFDLLSYNSDKDTYLLTDIETCQNFLDEYYIKGSITIKPEIKDSEEKKLSKEEQMNIIIDNIRNGKTDKEAAETAGINIYKITHWFNEGRNKSGKENIDFYNHYREAKKEAKINSFKNFYVMESFSKKDITIADTLRKQQMESILKEIGSGSSLKTAAFNSSITYETLQYWYKRGKQNFGEEYNEFYEKINILQSPIDVPKPIEENKEIAEKHSENKEHTEEINNENLHNLYKHILDPLPYKFKQLFNGVKESESGFAWVKKEKNSWRYDRQQKDNRQSVTRQNIYELYLEVKKCGYIWGVRDLKKAKETLKLENPNIIIESDNEFKDDEIFKNILNPISPEYSNRFRKPSSSGLAWVNKINNTWVYANPKDNIRLYDGNIYNLYLKVKKQKLPWGVRDLQKAKETLGLCEKPNEIQNPKNNLSKLTCAYFTNNEIIKTIINGNINDNELISIINNFKEFEEKLIRIITTRHSKFTELFIEFNLDESDLHNFKKITNSLNCNQIKEKE